MQHHGCLDPFSHRIISDSFQPPSSDESLYDYVMSSSIIRIFSYPKVTWSKALIPIFQEMHILMFCELRYTQGEWCCSSVLMKEGGRKGHMSDWVYTSSNEETVLCILWLGNLWVTELVSFFGKDPWPHSWWEEWAQDIWIERRLPSKYSMALRREELKGRHEYMS